MPTRHSGRSTSQTEAPKFSNKTAFSEQNLLLNLAYDSLRSPLTPQIRPECKKKTNQEKRQRLKTLASAISEGVTGL